MELLVAMAMVVVLLGVVHTHSIQQQRQVLGAFAELKAGHLAQRELVRLRRRPMELRAGRQPLRIPTRMHGHLPELRGELQVEALPGGLWSVQVLLSWRQAASRRRFALHSWIRREDGR